MFPPFFRSRTFGLRRHTLPPEREWRGLAEGLVPYAAQFVKTVGILEKTILTLENSILTLEKTVSTLDFSNVLTVFDSSDSGMLQNGNPTFDLHHKGRMPVNARFFVEMVICRENLFLRSARNNLIDKCLTYSYDVSRQSERNQTDGLPCKISYIIRKRTPG